MIVQTDYCVAANGAPVALLGALMSNSPRACMPASCAWGWHAEIDRNAAPIFEVNEAMRGVVVPRGDHTITMWYRPASALAGGLLSLIGVAGAVAALVTPQSLSRRGESDTRQRMESMSNPAF